MTDRDALITTRQASIVLGLAESTLYSSSCKRRGAPSPVKRVGNVVFYRLGDVLDYRDKLQARRKALYEPTMNGERVYTIAQAAKMAGLSRTRIYQLIEKGRVKPLTQPDVYNGRMVLTRAQVDALGGES